MKEYLHEFFEEFDYPQEACDALLQAYDAIQGNPSSSERFCSLLKRYESDANSDMAQMLDEMGELSAEVNVHEYTGKLLLPVCMTRALREHYRRAGLDDEMWFLSMCDLKWKLVECRLVHGIWGSFVSRWFGRFFDLTRFGIGRLQFEIIPFEREYEKNGVKLSPESKVINVHIPRTGSPLDPAQTAWSFKKAAAFFREKYALDPIVFVCHSWLLFPRNLEVLSPNSNIRRFAENFEIMTSGEDADYSQVWRLFDRNYDGDVDSLPQDSSFRRAYADWIRRGEKIGWGHGIYVYSD